jgi:thymidylate kinase
MKTNINLERLKQNHKSEIDGLNNWFKNENKELYAKTYKAQYEAIDNYFNEIEKNIDKYEDITKLIKKIWSK